MKHSGRPAGGKTPRLKPLKQALLRGEPHAGPVPLTPLLQRSWQRSQEAGLTPAGLGSAGPHASAVQLARARDRHHELIAHARPVLEFLFEQTRGTDSVVLLADAQGMVLDAIGDTGFSQRAARVALRPGVRRQTPFGLAEKKMQAKTRVRRGERAQFFGIEHVGIAAGAVEEVDLHRAGAGFALEQPAGHRHQRGDAAAG